MSDLAGNAVGCHRSPDGLADRDPETGWVVTTVEGTVHDQCGCHGPLTRPDGPPEIFRIGKPVNFGQHGATLLRGWTPGEPSAYAVRRERPLDRRLAIIDRPARVRIRARNPCLRARRRLLGWKVRFMVRAPRWWPNEHSRLRPTLKDGQTGVDNSLSARPDHPGPHREPAVGTTSILSRIHLKSTRPGLHEFPYSSCFSDRSALVFPLDVHTCG